MIFKRFNKILLYLCSVYTWILRTIDAAYNGSPFASGEFGIYPVSLDKINTNKPSGYYLGQNRPNPFTSQTTVSYTINKEEIVTLKVYNNQGEEVSILVNEKKQAGNYQVTLDATNLSDGVYYYRLNAGGFSETKKLVITMDYVPNDK